MINSNFNRRSFGKLVGGAAAFGLTSGALQGTARARSVKATADVSLGFRPAVTTRLDVLEADAKFGPIRQGELSFRPWIDTRVTRMEARGAVGLGDLADDPWRGATMDRVDLLDRQLPGPLKFRFTTHMPLDVAGDQVATVLRQRIKDGFCNGVFLYSNAGTALEPFPVFDVITKSGPPVPIIMSPKKVDDPVKLAAFMNYWAARPEWLPYVRVAFWQEFQGDFGGTGQPPISAWQDSVNVLADAGDRVGIASLAHAETWNLHPSQPDGGADRLIQFLDPVIDRLGGGISWSLYVFNEKAGAGNDYVTWMNAFMASNYPYTSYGVAAYGDSVPFGLPAGDPRRVARANRVESVLGDISISRATFGGYYALPKGPDPTRNFWDDLVAAKVKQALAHEVG